MLCIAVVAKGNRLALAGIETPVLNKLQQLPES